MTKYIILICSVILFWSCREDETVDITVMPDETTVGANTFGCLIDGWLYVGGRYHTLFSPSYSFTYHEADSTMSAVVQVKFDKTIQFSIKNPEKGVSIPFSEFLWEDEELTDGSVFITRMDKKQHIISGRFEGGRITEGRFDMHYKAE